MGKRFVASNGFTVTEEHGTLAVHVDNLFVGEEHITALHEYFDQVNKG